MKFRDPKTGNVFQGIQRARNMYCQERDCDINCELDNRTEDCIVYCDCHPTEAARLMGYEVIEECIGDANKTSAVAKNATVQKEDDMSEQKKPRLAEVLGVEVGERFRISANGGTLTFWVTEKGYFKTDPPEQVGSTHLLLDAINHPESIIRGPRLTEAELERCRACGAKYVMRDGESIYVYLYSADPRAPERIGADYIGQLKADLFPSVRPGDCIEAEVTGDDQ